MKKRHISPLSLLFFSILSVLALIPHETKACSRVVYKGDSALYIVGRSLDWKTPIPTNLYVYPRGIEKQTDNKPGALKWKSRYGAVYAVGYDGGITEGMNEKGLVMNGLFCKGTVYVNDSTKNFPPMSLSVFTAWVIDNCATTAEAVEYLRKNRFSISGVTFDGGTVSTLHWGITDPSGNTAILEYSKGDMHIYQSDSLRVLTNDPVWPQMDAIIKYWRGVGGRNMLPGTVRSADRCVRADFFIHNVEAVYDADLGATITLSVMRNVSVPYLYTVNGEPNVSSTQWVSMANLRDRRYYFIPVTSLGIWYVDLTKCDLREGQKIKKLTVSDAMRTTGCANHLLKSSEGFTPMY